MKAFTLATIVICALSISSCCCQSQPEPPLRPMEKDLVTDTQTVIEPPVIVEPVKVVPMKK